VFAREDVREIHEVGRLQQLSQVSWLSSTLLASHPAAAVHLRRPSSVSLLAVVRDCRQLAVSRDLQAASAASPLVVVYTLHGHRGPVSQPQVAPISQNCFKFEGSSGFKSYRLPPKLQVSAKTGHILHRSLVTSNLYILNAVRCPYKRTCMLPIAVARYSSGRVTKSQGEGAILGVVRVIQRHWQSSLQPSLPRSLQKASFNCQ